MIRPLKAGLAALVAVGLAAHAAAGDVVLKAGTLHPLDGNGSITVS